ncbi:MAG TPA: hypothetical protein DEP46_06175 [Blastocatellia bacterium]|nr:hypothetical protein [Blastocatellia bacterium]
MIREALEKKAAKVIAGSRYGKTKAGRISAAILDEDRLEPPDSLEETLQDPRAKSRTLMLCGGVNAVSWLSIFLIPNVVSTVVMGLELILTKGSVLLLAPAFGFTMLASFSLLRTWFPPVPKTSDDGGVMSTYEHGVDSLLTWKLWVASAAIGGINAILLIASYLWMTGEWLKYTQ